MLPSERIQALQKKHALLSALIEQEENNKSTDDLFLQKLKKQKLQIKDALLDVRDIQQTVQRRFAEETRH